MTTTDTIRAKIDELEANRAAYLKEAQAQMERFNGAILVLKEMLEKEAQNGTNPVDNG